MIDDRAISSALTYSLVTVITLALTAGLVFGAESLVNDQRERTVQNQLDVVGQRLSSTVMTVDRMGRLDGTTTVGVTREFPQRTAGSQYRIRVSDSPRSDRGTIYVESRDTGMNVSVPFRLSGAEIEPTTVNGGPVRIVYDPTTSPDTVRVERA